MSAIKRSILINNIQYRFCKDFFAPNEAGLRQCPKCKNKSYGKYDRVDTEFLGEETLCLKHWIKEVYHV